MECVRQRELAAGGLDGSAFVRAGQLIERGALAAEPSLQLDDRDDRRVELLRQLHRLADVIGVAVRDRDDVDSLRLLLRVGTLRVAEPRVDVDALLARGVEPERGVAEPRECCVRHRSPLLRRGSRERNEGAAAGVANPWWPVRSPFLPLTLALGAFAADGAGMH